LLYKYTKNEKRFKIGNNYGTNIYVTYH